MPLKKIAVALKSFGRRKEIWILEDVLKTLI